MPDVSFQIPVGGHLESPWEGEAVYLGDIRIHRNHHSTENGGQICFFRGVPSHKPLGFLVGSLQQKRGGDSPLWVGFLIRLNGHLVVIHEMVPQPVRLVPTDLADNLFHRGPYLPRSNRTGLLGSPLQSMIMFSFLLRAKGSSVTDLTQT